jgi:hypothetical protein
LDNYISIKASSDLYDAILEYKEPELKGKFKKIPATNKIKQGAFDTLDINPYRNLYSVKLTEFKRNYSNITTQIREAKTINKLLQIAYKWLGFISGQFPEPEISENVQKMKEDLLGLISKKSTEFNSDRINNIRKEEIIQLKESLHWNFRPWINEHLNTQGAEEDIFIIHGGGLNYILNFLEGREEGYNLEDVGKGIQVVPVSSKEAVPDETLARSITYAKTRSQAHWDLAAILTAKIPAKFLKFAPNNYEAGFPTMFFSKMSHITINLYGHTREAYTDAYQFYASQYIHQQALKKLMIVNKKFQYLDLSFSAN